MVQLEPLWILLGWTEGLRRLRSSASGLSALWRNAHGYPLAPPGWKEQAARTIRVRSWRAMLKRRFCLVTRDPIIKHHEASWVSHLQYGDPPRQGRQPSRIHRAWPWFWPRVPATTYNHERPNPWGLSHLPRLQYLSNFETISIESRWCIFNSRYKQSLPFWIWRACGTFCQFLPECVSFQLIMLLQALHIGHWPRASSYPAGLLSVAFLQLRLLGHLPLTTILPYCWWELYDDVTTPNRCVMV